MMLIHEELKPFQELADQFARNELAPGREEHDRYPLGPFYHAVLAQAHQAGFLGITLPEDLGGIGQGVGALCVMIETLSRSDASLAGIILTTAIAQEILMQAGDRQILKKIADDAVSAEEVLIAFPAFANPSELSPTVFANRSGAKCLLFGTCEYLVLGGLARYGLIPARFSGEKEYSFFLVNLELPGISRSEPLMSLGLHACPAVDVRLKDVEGYLVGVEGKGTAVFEKAADKMHAAAAAIACGIMKGSFLEAYAYAKERFQGGREIIKWSELRMILSIMSLKVHTAEMVLAEACRAIEGKLSGWEMMSRAAAIRIQDDACDVTTEGIQVLGGYGYMKDYGQEKRFRDAKQVQAFLGFSPMKKLKYFERLGSQGE